VNGHHFNRDVETLLSREIDDVLLDVRGLALMRDLLAERGASSEEIESHRAALERQRAKLIDLIGGTASREDGLRAHAA
jgi:hypothetical protein